MPPKEEPALEEKNTRINFLYFRRCRHEKAGEVYGVEGVGMTHWTEKQYREYMTRQKMLKEFLYPEEEKADPGKEAKLQGKIMQWAREWGRPCQCFRQSRKAKGFLVPGWPD